MRISNAGPSTAPGQPGRVRSRADEARSGEFVRHLEARPAAPLPALDGVLALQAVPQETGERRRAVRRGQSLLDELQELQVGLIDGRLAESALDRLAALLEASPASVDDPRLAAVVGQIELRAALEMAKLRRGQG